MTGSKKDLFIVSLALAILATLACVWAWPGHGQSITSNVKPEPAPIVSSASTVKKTIQPLASAPGDSAWAVAAQQNNLLSLQLTWVFGGREQRGWALYTPLIARTLDTEATASTSDFAQALARWQQSARLPANGLLDSDTLYQLIAAWQAKRIKNYTSPSPDQLLTAPPTDFYAPERPAELRQVEKNTYAAYKRMVAAAIADPSLGLAKTETGELAPTEKYLKIISSYRSPEYQAQLRRQSPEAGRAQLAVNSPHSTGRALDLYVGGDPVSTKDANRAMQTQTRVYQWLVHNAARFGFQPYYYEPWHWEYTGQEVAAH
jgi:zinc D-Ala-D-Ala carboxypeptidase